MADAISIQELIDAKIDTKDLGEALNEKKIIIPRYGDTFKSLPLAIQEVIETGGFEPFATEALLKTSLPVLTKKAAYALDTHKIWLWEDDVWKDTGLSAIDQANANALDMNKTFIGEKADLNALFLFEDTDGTVVTVVKKDGNIITPYADLNQIQTDVNFVNMFSDSFEQSVNKVSFSTDNDNSLFDFEDNEGQKVISITKRGDLKINSGKTVLSASSISAGEQSKSLYAKEFAEAAYLNLNLQRLLLSNTSTLSPFAGSFKQQFTIKDPADFLALKISQGEKIKIDTPYYLKNSGGYSDQVVHPFICKSSKTVSGFNYIMLITPFHATNDMYENPCVYGSNDLREFELLKQFSQPLADVLPTGYYNYNSDPCCVFDHITGEFCVINRNTQSIDGANVSTLSAIRTKDFNTWSEPQNMNITDDMLSPSIVYDTTLNKWVMFGRTGLKTFGVSTSDSLTGQWSTPRNVTAPFNTWHMEVRYCGNGYVAILGDNNTATGGALYIAYSTDTINWQYSDSIFTGAHLPAYKPSITHEFVDANHIKFKVVWTSSDMDSALANKWCLFTAETNIIEVI